MYFVRELAIDINWFRQSVMSTCLSIWKWSLCVSLCCIWRYYYLWILSVWLPKEQCCLMPNRSDVWYVLNCVMWNACLWIQRKKSVYYHVLPFWYCINSTGEALPFNNIIDNEEFKHALFCKDHFDEYWDRFSYKLFEPLDSNEFDCISPLDEVDPDLNFYHGIFQHMTANCSYLKKRTQR